MRGLRSILALTIALAPTLALAASPPLTYDLAFTTGLTIVTSGATDITVSYQ